MFSSIQYTTEFFYNIANDNYPYQPLCILWVSPTHAPSVKYTELYFVKEPIPDKEENKDQ